MTKTPEIDFRDDHARNYIINGNLDFWQRNTSFAAIADNTYTADRFLYLKSGAMVHTVAQSSDTPNVLSNFSLHVDCTTADASIAAGDRTHIAHRLEGYEYALLAGKTVTLSFKVKSSKTGINCVAFKNSGSDRSYVAEYTIDTANIWLEKSVTLTLDETGGTWDYVNGIGLDINFTLAAGTDFHTTKDAWQTGDFLATSNQINNCDSIVNDFKIDQIQINEGGEALPFRRAGRSITEELQMCQRYYEKSYEVDEDPGTATVVFGAVYASSAGGTTTGNSSSRFFVVEKRATPTILTYSYTGTLGKMHVGTYGSTETLYDSALISSNAKSFIVKTTITAVSCDIAYHHWTADAEL